MTSMTRISCPKDSQTSLKVQIRYLKVTYLRLYYGQSAVGNRDKQGKKVTRYPWPFLLDETTTTTRRPRRTRRPTRPTTTPRRTRVTSTTKRPRTTQSDQIYSILSPDFVQILPDLVKKLLNLVALNRFRKISHQIWQILTDLDGFVTRFCTNSTRSGDENY